MLPASTHLTAVCIKPHRTHTHANRGREVYISPHCCKPLTRRIIWNLAHEVKSPT